MRLISHRNENNKSGAVSLVAPVRNEIPIIPHFLEHYRKLGVSNFFFIDNNSSDGTTDFLVSQKDCQVYSTNDDFKGANFGIDWVNEVINRHCVGAWALFVDCDEFFVYPDCESTSISAYCNDIQSRGYNTVFSAMIDMYPKGDFMSTPILADANPLTSMPYFDGDYFFRRWPKRPWEEYGAFNLQVLGGPRLRLLSNLETEISRGGIYYTLCNQIDRFIDRVPVFGVDLLAKIWPIEMPAQQKKPLNLVCNQFRYHSNHSCSNTLVDPRMTSLLHFKICQDLRAKMADRRMIAGHYRKGLSYQQLRLAIEKFKNPSLLYEGSLKFNSSDDLLKIGLIGESVGRLWLNADVQAIRTYPISKINVT